MSDIELGKKIGAMTIIVCTGNGIEAEAAGAAAPDGVAADLLEAAGLVADLIGRDGTLE